MGDKGKKDKAKGNKQKINKQGKIEKKSRINNRKVFSMEGPELNNRPPKILSFFMNKKTLINVYVIF